MRKLLLTSTVTLVVALLLAPAISAAPLDLEDPNDAVKAMRKLQCHLEDGKPAIYWWSGTTFSRVPGEKDRRLFTYEGMNVRACVTIEDPERGYGYRMVTKEVLFYIDPETGGVLRKWTNPWTGQEVDVVQIANDPVNSRPIQANGSRGPFRFNATMKDGRGWLMFEVPLYYPNPLGGDYQKYVGGTYHAIEMFSFYFDAEALVDENVGGLDDAHVGWTRVAQWLPWMEMGNRVGAVMYHGSGKRVRSWEDLPKVLRDEVALNYPGFDEPPPLDDDRPNETSWTYFKKWIEEHGEDEAAPSGH